MALLNLRHPQKTNSGKKVFTISCLKNKILLWQTKFDMSWSSWASTIQHPYQIKTDHCPLPVYTSSQVLLAAIFLALANFSPSHRSFMTLLFLGHSNQLVSLASRKNWMQKGHRKPSLKRNDKKTAFLYWKNSEIYWRKNLFVCSILIVQRCLYPLLLSYLQERVELLFLLEDHHVQEKLQPMVHGLIVLWEKVQIIYGHIQIE